MLAVVLVGLGVPLASTAVGEAPLAARLLAEPYETTGVRVNVSSMGETLGLATDGTVVYLLRSDGVVVTTPLAAIPLTPGSTFAATGTAHPVGWGVDGAPSLPGDLDRLSIAYSHGCLWITSNGNTEGSIGLSCIDVTDWSVTNIVVPEAYPLPEGYYFTYSSLIDFPDGRIGKVSKYEAVTGGYESVLRTYTITGEGSAATIAWSQDLVMFDENNWAIDEHGIATDGTYLYRIQWQTVSPNTKVWALDGASAATVVWQGSYTMPFGNMHYIAHNHIENYYLVGFFRGSSFFITTASDPGPGPGNPLTPAEGDPTSTADGCTVQVSNYDAAFAWGVSSDVGSASIDESGLVTVTGLAPAQSATISLTTSRTGFPAGSAEFECAALAPAAPGVPTDITVKSEGAQVSVAWNPPTDDGGSEVTGYEVQVRDEFGVPIDGATCTTDGALYCTVGGLDDGVAYMVVVRAVNAVDPGPWSSEFEVVPGNVPEEELLDEADSADLGVDDSTPVQGQSLEITAEGFRPGTQVDFWLHSTPTYLGAAMAGLDGVATLVADLPDEYLGEHTVQALGVGPETGADRNLRRGITISAIPAADGLVSTGSADVMPALIGSGLMLVLGVFLLLMVRRMPRRV